MSVCTVAPPGLFRVVVYSSRFQNPRCPITDPAGPDDLRRGVASRKFAPGKGTRSSSPWRKNATAAPAESACPITTDGNIMAFHATKWRLICHCFRAASNFRSRSAWIVSNLRGVNSEYR